MLTFRCDVLGSDLRREACGERHLRAKREQAKKGKSRHVLGSVTCARCELGAAHARGREPDTWPSDGRPVLSFETISRSEERSDPPGSRTSPTSGSGTRSERSSGPELVYVFGDDVHGAAFRADDGPKAAWLYEVDGVLLTRKGWTDRLGVSHEAIGQRLRRGWTVRDAVLTPPGEPRPMASKPAREPEPEPHPPKATDIRSPAPRRAGRASALRRRP